jgi:uncharacterized phage protein (TIGR02218 family)
MADARVTQDVGLALYVSDAEARITSDAVLALYGLRPPARISQDVALILYDKFSCLTKLAECWKITRRDGTILGFTTHDDAIVYDGTTYKACESLRSGASLNSTTAGIDNGDVEFMGLIDDDAITEADLYNGLYDGASVEVFQLQWDSLSKPKRLAKGLVAKVTHSQSSYVCSVQTPGAKLTQQSLLTTYTPSCRYQLGDSRCTVPLFGYVQTGSVTGTVARNATNKNQYRQFRDAVRTENAGYFDTGLLTWTTGANVGIIAEVKTYLAGEIILWDIMPNEIAIGDEYTIKPGCNKSKEDCVNKFNNFINFGGFPHIPGQDAILQTPDAKA